MPKCPFPDSHPAPRSRKASTFLFQGLSIALPCHCACHVCADYQHISWNTSPPRTSGISQQEWRVLKVSPGEHGALFSLTPWPCSCQEMASHTVSTWRDMGPIDFSHRLVPSYRNAHLGLGSSSFSVILRGPALHRSQGLRGFTFSFIFLEARGWGARAPCQRFMGHLRLLALCPNAPQSLHFTCGGGQ